MKRLIVKYDDGSLVLSRFQDWNDFGWDSGCSFRLTTKNSKYYIIADDNTLGGL